LQQKGGRKAKGLEKKENDKNKKERRKRVKTLERERRLDLGYNSSS